MKFEFLSGVRAYIMWLSLYNPGSDIATLFFYTNLSLKKSPGGYEVTTASVLDIVLS